MFLPLWKKDALRKSRPTNHLGFLAETGIFARLSIASWSTIATASCIEWQSRLSQFWSFKMAYIYPKWYSTWMPYMYAWGPHKRISLSLVSVIQVAVCIVTPKGKVSGCSLKTESKPASFTHDKHHTTLATCAGNTWEAWLCSGTQPFIHTNLFMTLMTSYDCWLWLDYDICPGWGRHRWLSESSPPEIHVRFVRTFQITCRIRTLKGWNSPSLGREAQSSKCDILNWQIQAPTAPYLGASWCILVQLGATLQWHGTCHPHPPLAPRQLC